MVSAGRSRQAKAEPFAVAIVYDGPMRNVVVYAPRAPEASTCTIAGVAVGCEVRDTQDTGFDPSVSENANRVLVRKRGFSVNYRDRALILAAVLRAPGTFYPIGSDFVGDVIAAGPAVKGLSIGDRVIGDAAYPDSGVPGVRPGVPVNSASKELQIFHEAKLARIPEAMTDDVAACFTIGAQTSFSMVRRTNPGPSDRILVTGGSSNTSLFVIHALGERARFAWVTTTSARYAEKLRALGVAGVILLDRGGTRLSDHPTIRQMCADTGGFTVVIDPFFDLYLAAAVDVMAVGGRYITCGLMDQHTGFGVGQPAPASVGPLITMTQIMLKNLQILGNCIGTTRDLQAAIDAHAAGTFPVLIDGVYGGDDAAGFLDRSYNAADRFGKVVFRYT